MKLASLLAAGAVAASLLAPAAAQAAYPDKPVKIVVPFSAGGIVDSVARLLGEKLAARYGQPFVIENRSGAGGAIGTDYASKAAADGYTLLLVSPSHAVAPTLQKTVKWNPVRDFKAIAGFGIVPNVIVVHPSVPAQTMAELIALAKKSDPPLTYATAGVGTSNHLAGELLAQEAKIPLTHVPYKGQSDALNDLLAGRVTLMPLTAALAMPHVQSGKLRALAVTTAKRASALPDLPTVAEAGGLPDYAVGTWFGLVAPAGTPAPVLNQLAGDVAQIVQMPDVQARFATLGMETDLQSPAEFDAFVAAEYEKWAKVIKKSDAGFK
ncbi:tripartite tricarboxylate transporter substrate binding protein [Bordetella petrii]|uniref:tripartite tricarboxylate transporter substrate binding protein n=1 Tax=Bordetella petrii TaxID=94624 RepID=UPI001E60BBA4|nr:tripartite tricarboxylate transporter substrate binding protein [Bordetella petrii]MCD0502831.1 tripartite tricarboxylate transporter substrate binding protein [Bordetella petrii]